MHLQHPVTHRQTDTAARFLGREVEIENLIPNLGSNPNALVPDFNGSGSVVTTGCDGQSPAASHRLHAIQDNIQQRLLDQVVIGLDQQSVGSQMSLDLYSEKC